MLYFFRLFSKKEKQHSKSSDHKPLVKTVIHKQSGIKNQNASLIEVIDPIKVFSSKQKRSI